MPKLKKKPEIPAPEHYTFEWTQKQKQEIDALLFFAGLKINLAAAQHRARWIAIAHMALGKSVLISKGRYGESDEEVDTEAWSTELREISEVILNRFQPGDGKI